MALEQVGGVEAKSGISRLTLEHLYWKVLSNNNLDEATAYVAFASGESDKPAPSDWTLADIVPDPDDGSAMAVRLLVGPGSNADLTPPADAALTYRVWVKIDAEGQEIVRRVGTLVVR